jgi:hypothetical protein
MVRSNHAGLPEGHGRQRKLGKMVSGGGCLVVLLFAASIPLALAALLIVLL